MSLSALIYDEVNISFSAETPESGTNDVIMNSFEIGGNEFDDALLANGSVPSLQGSNVKARLRARGDILHRLLKKLYDIKWAVGGLMKREQLWFHSMSRYFTVETNEAGLYFPVDRSAFVCDSRSARQGFAARGRGTTTSD